jgi:hypothetical protein
VVPPVDAKENDYSVKNGLRILSSYAVGCAGERVWIVTEADRSSTCILLPEESWSREKWRPGDLGATSPLSVALRGGCGMFGVTHRKRF